MSEAPSLVAISNTIQVTWSKWNESQGGDGPVDKYLVYWRESGSGRQGAWLGRVEVGHYVLVHTLKGLKSRTLYEVAVAAARPGDGGEGPISPSATVRSLEYGRYVSSLRFENELDISST